MRETCKYYNDGLKTCAALISAVYELGGSTGGLAHVAIDDENVDDSSLKWTINLCEQEKYRLEAPVVKLLCELLLKQPLGSRLYLVQQLSRFGIEQLSQCFSDGPCEECFIEAEVKEWMEELKA